LSKYSVKVKISNTCCFCCFFLEF